MKTRHPAILVWVPAANGGRQSPPAGPVYSTLAAFDEDKDFHLGAWSIVAEFVRVFKNPRHVLADISFLMDEAPESLLHVGSRFALMEGKRCVARGTVLSRAVPIPDEINEFEEALISS